MSESCFSDSYSEARRRFIGAAKSLGADIKSYEISPEVHSELVIDVAILGASNCPTLVLSSGVHGVEGFFGSATQLGLLDRLKETAEKLKLRYVLIHAVNPYGFSFLRRVNEDNVDLNRNFLTDGDQYHGTPPGYARLNSFLNPQSPPPPFEPFKLIATIKILQNGLQSLKQAIASGQYEYTRGLFFGGVQPCASTKAIQNNCDLWIGSSSNVLHIDFHTGLGRYGHYKLLHTGSGDSNNRNWYAQTFGSANVELLDSDSRTAYRVSGSIGEWMQHHFRDRTYRFVGAEFGTYNVLRVLAAMRAENRAHYYSDKNSPAYQLAKSELRECFFPTSSSWRRSALRSALRIIEQGECALRRQCPR